MEVLLTNREIEFGPVFPHIKWGEDAIRAWLGKQGFDLNKPIFRTLDEKRGLMFKQARIKNSMKNKICACGSKKKFKKCCMSKYS